MEQRPALGEEEGLSVAGIHDEDAGQVALRTRPPGHRLGTEAPVEAAPRCEFGESRSGNAVDGGEIPCQEYRAIRRDNGVGYAAGHGGNGRAGEQDMASGAQFWQQAESEEKCDDKSFHHQAD